MLIYALIALSAFLFYQYGRSLWKPVALKAFGKQTVSEVIAKYGASTRAELAPLFASSGIEYPPKHLALIAFKDTQQLELWAAGESERYKLITRYGIQATSGNLGPKLREGDRQVPEGMYKVIGFNPNSAYHLSMKINYPNAFDLKHANAEGRDQPGTNIFIHGRAVSIGCLAMGDEIIEKLFTLVYETGRSNTTVLISPTDPSKRNLIVPAGAPSWTVDLYKNITEQYLKITK